MADAIRYGMGQLRYNSSPPNPHMELLSFSTQSVNTKILSTSETEAEGAGSEYYKDVYLAPEGDFSFDVNTSYLLHLDIPKDPSYDCIYQLKMVDKIGADGIVNASNLDYQMIKYVTVPRDMSAGNTSRVILYPVNSSGNPWVVEDGSYTTKVAIAKTLNENPENGDVVFDEATNEYYVYYNNSENKSIKNKNDTIMGHTWVTTDEKTEAVGFNIIFSPRNTDVTYKGIFIQMQRSNLDYDIFSDGAFGRKMDIEKDSNYKAEIYKLNNLIPENIDALNSIGVYSHPNLLMAINGEEIRVGQSGYYELNDFDITSLAVAANDSNDNFTIDYQYKIIN